MRNFLWIIQFISIALLVYETGYIFVKWKTKIQGYLFLICLSTLVNDIGYCLAIKSEGLNEYLLGVKMSYLGRVWVPFAFLLFVNALCKKRMSKYIVAILGTIHFSVFVVVATAECHSLYFKNMYLNTAGIFPCLGFESGFVKNAYNYVVLGYMAYGLSILLYRIVKEENKIQKKRLHLVLAAIISESGFYLLEMYGNTVGYDDTVVGYAIGSFFMFIAIVKYSLLDTLKIIGDYIADEVSEGIVVVNKKNEIEYFNKTASIIFPQLKSDSANTVEIIRRSSLDKTPIYIGERIYTATEKEIIDEGTDLGTIYVITDTTDHINALTLYENYNKDLENQVEEKTAHIREIQAKTILGMAQIIESRDLSTGGHVKRTSDVVKIFSNKLLSSDLGFSKEFLAYVIRSAPLHDLGKIGVDDAVLRKQGKFTDEEYAKMKEHSKIGATLLEEMLSSVEDEEFVKVAINVAHYHHEKVNGQGYPEGVKGEDIPVEARIMALADVFDALVSKRCYKEAFSYEKAFEIIKNDSGTHFCPILSEIFIQCREELEAYYDSII